LPEAGRETAHAAIHARGAGAPAGHRA
jgi:hypothetical protein